MLGLLLGYSQLHKGYLAGIIIVSLALGLLLGPYLPHPTRWKLLISKQEVDWGYPISDSTISIIIPTYNEGRDLVASTLYTAQNNALRPDLLELIVADGGSSDDTVSAIKKYSAVKLAVSKGGRGPAINAGIALAKGDIILMLHSDCKLGHGYDQLLRQAFADPRVLLTAFEFDPDVDHYPFLKILQAQVNSRSHLFWLPYGDQALAIKREDLDYYFAGRIPDHKIMEDFELVVQARDIALDNGKIISILPQSVVSSPRRFINRGVLKATLINWFYVTAYVWGGKSPEQIFKWYYTQ